MLMSILSSSVLAGIVASKLAYLDPGSGSYLIQILIATLLGGAFVIKAFWRQILHFLGIKNKSVNNTDISNSLDLSNEEIININDLDLSKRNIQQSIIKLCSVYGLFNIKEYVNKNIDLIKEVYLQVKNGDDGIEIIRSIVEDAIINHQLKGLIDSNSLEYFDRDLIIKKTKSINVNVDMNLNQLINELAKKGVSSNRIECASCGQALEISSSDTSFVKCHSCGTTNHVVDLFDKYNTLLKQ